MSGGPQMRVVEGRVEEQNQCEFCLGYGWWPTVILAGPYWTHETCLIKAVEEGRRS